MDDFNNPFEDASVQAARSAGGPTVGRSSGRAVDEFNPFEQQQQQQPAVLPTQHQQQHQQHQQQHQQHQQQHQQQSGVSNAELERRQRELESKARELERREEEQMRREQEFGGAAAASRNNWPPLPSFCPVGPCFYQDFELEIPVEFCRIVKIGYYLWMAHVTVLLVNILGALAYFIAGGSNAASVMVVSLLVCAAFAPLSFLCWFRPLYKAFKTDSSFNFFIFFFVFGAQFCVSVVQCLGMDYLGSCGWINGMQLLGSNKSVAAFMLVIASAFTALAVIDLILLLRVHRMYRSTGASFAKAKQEFSHGMLTNESVRGAAADAAFGAARSGGRY